LIDSAVSIGAFPLLTTSGSFVGALLITSFTVSSVGTPRWPFDYGLFGTILVNSSLSGAVLGFAGCVICSAAYKLVHPNDPIIACADKVLNTVQAPLFWIALADGILVGALTTARFAGALIWKWSF
jgi:hypothetical protein